MTSVYGAEVSPSNESVREARAPRAMIFFIYLLAGPPAGATLFVAGVVAYGIGLQLSGAGVGIGYNGPSETSMLQTIATIPVFWIVASVLSYIFGGLQAAGTGLLLTFMSGEDGRFGYGLAFFAALVPSFFGAVLFGRDAPGYFAVLFAIGVAASLILRFHFRKRFSRLVVEEDTFTRPE